MLRCHIRRPEIGIEQAASANRRGDDESRSEIRCAAPHEGACRLYQDHLNSRNYQDVIVGHARSLRYNAGNWPDIKYGDNLRERERNMIEECDSAIVIWMNKSSVIAGNLERLKWQEKPTFLYESSSYTKDVYSGPLDPKRVYEPYLYQKLRTKYGKPPSA